MTTLRDIVTSSVGDWTLAAPRSTITVRCKTMWGLATVTGTFTDFEGVGRADGGVTGRVAIRAGSLRTGGGKRDEHLRSADFFDVDNHPEIVVEVGDAQPAGDDRARLGTVLTIRGVARPVELPVTIRVLDDGSLELAGHCTVDRAEFGVSGNLLGMVGPAAELSAALVFVRA